LGATSLSAATATVDETNPANIVNRTATRHRDNRYTTRSQQPRTREHHERQPSEAPPPQRKHQMNSPSSPQTKATLRNQNRTQGSGAVQSCTSPRRRSLSRPTCPSVCSIQLTELHGPTPRFHFTSAHTKEWAVTFPDSTRVSMCILVRYDGPSRQLGATAPSPLSHPVPTHVHRHDHFDGEIIHDSDINSPRRRLDGRGSARCGPQRSLSSVVWCILKIRQSAFLADGTHAWMPRTTIRATRKDCR